MKIKEIMIQETSKKLSGENLREFHSVLSLLETLINQNDNRDILDESLSFCPSHEDGVCIEWIMSHQRMGFFFSKSHPSFWTYATREILDSGDVKEGVSTENAIRRFIKNHPNHGRS